MKGGKLGWYGQDEAVDTATQTTSKNVRLIIKDARDILGRKCELPNCDHVKREISYYLCGENEDADADLHEYETHDSPFPGCSFFIIPAEPSTQRTPHERFPSTMEPLYAETPWANLLTTWLAAMIRHDYSNDDLVINVGSSDPAVLAMEGNNEPFIDLQAAQEGKIAKVAGHPERLPKNISPHLMPMLSLHLERLGRFMPNRFVMGYNYGEVAQGTGTANALATQQSRLPYNTWLSESDKAILRSRKYAQHAIQYWGLGDPDEAATEYYAIMTGSNRNVTTSGPQAKRGEVISVTAKSFDFDYDLLILTESMTDRKSVVQGKSG